MIVESSLPRVERRTFAGQNASIGEARRFVRDVAAGVVDGADVGGDMELAVSELVTNAVEYGGAAPVTVAIALTADPTTVTISVASVRTPSSVADPSTWAGPAPGVRTGRGLAIVRSISDEVSVEADESTVTVHCSFRVD